uniref:Uncharacterized protein n=1 Tax=Ciona intestinalis TaxID=7719 RepID=H2XPA8_CIOIN
YLNFYEKNGSNFSIVIHIIILSEGTARSLRSNTTIQVI